MYVCMCSTLQVNLVPKRGCFASRGESAFLHLRFSCERHFYMHTWEVYETVKYENKRLSRRSVVKCSANAE